MTHRSFCIIVIVLASATVSALEVEPFVMGKHRWTIVHEPGGLTIKQVKSGSKAVDVSVFGFFGRKTIKGSLLLHGVDWHVMYGKEVITDHFNRWVMASYPDGTVRICSSPEAAYQFGRPSFGAAGMKVPPKPNEKLPRQFWATKGRYYFRVRMFGTRWDCQRVAKQWGFEAMLHGDGNSSLAPGAKSPSIAKVYMAEDYQSLFAMR
jgi:hypothetical protein